MRGGLIMKFCHLPERRTTRERSAHRSQNKQRQKAGEAQQQPKKSGGEGKRSSARKGRSELNKVHRERKSFFRLPGGGSGGVEGEMTSRSTSAYQALLIRLRESETRKKIQQSQHVAARKMPPTSGESRKGRLALERGEGRAGTEPSSYLVGEYRKTRKSFSGTLGRKMTWACSGYVSDVIPGRELE
ncbi:hypothetical protein TNCV_1574781 [Trichonephila clavipes]|nr:hypothetical protein TNCV_1574781 [Trichonephila clavipes]